MSEEYRGSVFEKIGQAADGSGWKNVVLKWALYLVFPIILLVILYFVVQGKISPSVMVEVLNPGKNESNFNVPETGVEVEVKEAETKDKSKNINKKAESVSYISKVLSKLGEKTK